MGGRDGGRDIRQHTKVLVAAAAAATASLLFVFVVGVTLSPRGQSLQVELDSTSGLPSGWHKDVDSNGRTYYWNRKLGTSSWDPPTIKTAVPTPAPRQQHYLQQAHLVETAKEKLTQPRINQAVRVQPLPLTVAAEEGQGRSAAPGWDQMAVPLNQLRGVDGVSSAGIEPRTLQSLEGAAERGEDDEKKIAGELSPTAGWPHDLAGATGEDTSWIVGMHREPIWTDSMTRACGLTEPCPTGRADHGHGMQMDSNPYTDKRRTFDPYAYGDPYADAEARAATPGRNTYPWDPTQDAQFYGSEGADCSDGVLRDECYERPELDNLRKKQATWKKKYDEFSAPNAKAEGEAEEEEKQKEDDKEKSEEEQAEEQKKAQEAKEAAMKKDGLNGALLHMPEVTPWARSVKTGMLSAAHSLQTGMLHASAAVKATATEAAADAVQQEKQDRFVGGEPVLQSLGKVFEKVRTAYKEGKGFLSEGNLSELERKFLRAHGDRQQELARHQALSAFDSAVLRPKKSPTTLLAAVHASAPAISASKFPGAMGVKRKASAGKRSTGASMWESPGQVAADGLFGSSQATAARKDKGMAEKRAAAVKVLSAVGADSNDQDGPLPEVRAEAMKVAREAAEGAEKLITKVTGRKTSPWVETNIQKGVLRKQSTESNLMQLVKEHDDKLLKEASGLSADELSKAMEDADRDSKGKKAVSAKALTPWEQKVAQQGTLRHETVEQNLKAALKAREKMLWKEKTGWKSIKDMQQAEAFADNLEREIKARRKEEATHPLIPLSAKSLLHDETQHASAKKASSAAADEEMQARAKEAREQRELDRLREGEPLVKALQAEVENDEQELVAEAEQQRLTIKQLHTDQGKLNKQLKLEEHIDDPHASASHVGKGTVRASGDEGGKVGGRIAQEGRREGSGVDHKQALARKELPVHGLSGKRAMDDLDEYFAKQEVGGALDKPAHKKASH